MGGTANAKTFCTLLSVFYKGEQRYRAGGMEKIGSR